MYRNNNEEKYMFNRLVNAKPYPNVSIKHPIPNKIVNNLLIPHSIDLLFIINNLQNKTRIK